MSQQALETFRRRVWNDGALQAALLVPRADADFIARAVELGGDCGCDFSAGDVAEALNGARRAWFERNVPFARAGESAIYDEDHATFDGWLPVDFKFQGETARVEWCYFGETALDDPFFENSVQRRLSLPFNQVFRRRTSLKVLEDLYESEPRAKPTGLIFHLSRCGSTLVSQMLVRLRGAVVLSEPTPFDAILCAPNIDEETRIQHLRWMTSALGQACSDQAQSAQSPFFIKLDSWHICQWRIIERAFPDVPWIFLYRDPLEVLVSHEKKRGGQMMPGLVAPSWFGWNWDDVAHLSPDEYSARVLARMSEAALEAVQNSERGRLVNYTQLPSFMWQELPSHFGFAVDEAECEVLQSSAARDAKQPGIDFVADSKAKQNAASEQARDAAQLVAPLFEKLETMRENQSEKVGRK